MFFPRPLSLPLHAVALGQAPPCPSSSGEARSLRRGHPRHVPASPCRRLPAPVAALPELARHDGARGRAWPGVAGASGRAFPELVAGRRRSPGGACTLSELAPTGARPCRSPHRPYQISELTSAACCRCSLASFPAGARLPRPCQSSPAAGPARAPPHRPAWSSPAPALGGACPRRLLAELASAGTW
jgi:hypothetical protein